MGRLAGWGVCPMAARGRGVRGLALSVRLAPPLFDLPALLLHLGHSHGRSTFGGPAHIDGGGLGGLLHLLHGPGAAVGAGGAGGHAAGAGDASDIVMGYFSGGADPAPFPLGKLLFQLGRHDAAGAGLGGLTALFLAFDLIGLVPFLYFWYGVSLLKKAAGRAHSGRAPGSMGQVPL